MCLWLLTHFCVLVFGMLLLGFKHMPAGLLCPPDSFTDILQFVFALLFSQNTKAQCSADHYVFSSYTHAVVPMHPLSNLPIGILWYIRIDKFSWKKCYLGLGGRCEWWTLTAGSSCREPGELSHSSWRKINSSAGSAPCSFIAKPSFVSIKQLIPIC